MSAWGQYWENVSGFRVEVGVRTKGVSRGSGQVGLRAEVNWPRSPKPHGSRCGNCSW